MGTGLARVCRVNVDNVDSCELCFVLYEIYQAIEAPAVELVIVFTACSCRLSDTRKCFQLDSAYLLPDGIIDDGTADLVVPVPQDESVSASHPTVKDRGVSRPFC